MIRWLFLLNNRLRNLLWKVELNTFRFVSRGKNTQILRGTFILSENAYIGDHVYIGPGALMSCFSRCEIGTGSILGPQVTIYTANHKYEDAEAIPYDHDLVCKAVSIGENCWIGGNSIIVPGVLLGEGCVVAAGSVVTKSFAPGSIVGGNPAKLIKQRDMNRYAELKAAGKIYLKLKSEGISFEN